MLVLYDGTCGLCDRSVRWILDHDRDGVFTFAPLQGETAAALRATHPEIPEQLSTLVLVEPEGDGERVLFRSAAVLRILGVVGSPWRHLGILPRPLLDLGYRMVAAIRYRVFGKRDACRVPSPEERARFRP